MQIKNICISIILYCLLIYCIRYLQSQENNTPAVEEIKTETNRVDTVDKSVITKKKIRKDGTVKEETVTKKDVLSVQKTEQKSVQKTIPNIFPRFSVSSGLIFSDVINSRSPNDAYLGGGIRVVDKIWVEGTYHLKTKEVSGGIRYEW